MIRRALVCLGALLVVSAAMAADRPATRPSTQPAELVLTDIAGAPCKPLTVPSGSKGVVLLFLAHDCPISNAYAPEFSRLAAAYGAPGQFQFMVVHPFAELDVAEAKKHAAEYGLKMPVVIDRKREVTRHAGARVTPEAAVIGPDGRVLYVGRIDDKWAGYGRSRLEPTVRDLKDALDAVLAGKPAPAPKGPAVGCPIE